MQRESHDEDDDGHRVNGPGSLAGSAERVTRPGGVPPGTLVHRRPPGQAAPVLLVEKIAASLGIVAATVGVVVFLSTGPLAEVEDPFPRSVSAPVE